MCGQHEETKYLQIIFFGDLTNSKEVAQRLGHLAVVNVQEGIVHPVSCKRLVIGCLGLCDLILVMREDQIFATGMNIYLLTQITLTHNRALDVPAGTALTPAGIPVRLAFFLRLPQYEIQGIFLLIFTGD